MQTILRLLGSKELAYKNTSILLKGYVYHHQETCIDELCPLKKTKEQIQTEKIISQ